MLHEETFAEGRGRRWADFAKTSTFLFPYIFHVHIFL